MMHGTITSNARIYIHRRCWEKQAAVSQAVAQNWYVELAVYRGGYTVLGIVNENGVPCEEILRQVL